MEPRGSGALQSRTSERLMIALVASGGMAMELRILGPLQVVVEGRVVEPRAGKQQGLLAFFVLHANERVSTDRLIDALWGERPPSTAAAALQNQVTTLRRLLGSGADRDRGFELSPPPRARGARPRPRGGARAQIPGGTCGGAGRALRSALSLWRGRPFAGIENDAFAQVEIARLEGAGSAGPPAADRGRARPVCTRQSSRSSRRLRASSHCARECGRC